MNEKKGWISLHRKITDHWLYQEKRVFSKFEAWIDILLQVNHAEAKIVIQNTLFTIKKGQSINSLETWSKRWNWNKSMTRRFLKTLENDGMVKLRNEFKTTRLTVCKFEDYQDKRNADETQMKRIRNADETQLTPNNNDNKNNNENNENKDIDFLYKLYPSSCIVKNSSTGKSSKDKETLKRLLKEKTVRELELIFERYVRECKKDQVYMKNFSTFLNNLPDYETESINPKPKEVYMPFKNLYD